jgi:hypothetical protein
MRFSLPPDRFDRWHPVIAQSYAVYTPMIDEMALTIGDWIDQMRPGGYVHSASRMGKTRGVTWHLEAILNERFQCALPLVIWSREDESVREGSFWHKLLIASGFELVDPAKPLRITEAKYLFKMRLIALAKRADRNFVILLIDEAQDVSFKEWKWLVGLQNSLDLLGYHLCVISVGTQQMGYRHEFMAVSGNAHVASRFFAVHARFHGVQTVEELEYVLNGYDLESEWPAGSGRSYLQYFAPDDFANGARLKSASAIFWSALTELVPDKLKRKPEFPMQHICDAIENALFKLASGQKWSEVMGFASWVDALSKSGFSHHMRIIQQSGV